MRRDAAGRRIAYGGSGRGANTGTLAIAFFAPGIRVVIVAPGFLDAGFVGGDEARAAGEHQGFSRVRGLARMKKHQVPAYDGTTTNRRHW